ncbi:MAG: glycoside hydrolase [Lentimicrobiaceae bacterium]|nr:glycoside hydrolase [Lentimicrobiaceae bacterium]
MKKKVFYILILAILSSCNDVINNQPEAVLPIPSQEQIDWQKLETYAFIHFGLNTYNDLEWGYGNTPASTFNPVNLDCEQWVATLKQCGMKGVILTAKHHDGFCLWQTETTDYSIANSPYKNGKGDMVKELSDACKKYGLKFGLYLSPWDRNNSEYGREDYIETYHKQIDELTKNYGDLFEFWFDGANGGNGYYGGADETRSIDARKYYDYERARDTILKRHPNAMIFGGTCQTIRWVGNEQGWAGDTDWCMINPELSDNTKHLNHGSENGTHWIPAEVDVSIRPGWFYHKREDHQVKSVAQLTDIYYRSVGHNANLLLNFPINLDGKIPALDSLRATEWHEVIVNDFKDNILKNAEVRFDNERGRKFKAENVIDDDWNTYWATDDGYNFGTISFSFDKPVKMNRVVLQEYIPLGQRVKDFYMEGELNGKWFKINPFDTLSTIGYKRIVRFNTVELDKLIIYFEESRGPLCINNIEAYCAPILLTEPKISRNYDNIVTIESSDNEADIYYTTDGSNPDENSLLYDKAFVFNKKGIIKAITYDPISKKKSDVTVKELDLPKEYYQTSSSNKIFDGNTNSMVYLDIDEPIVITFKEEQNISGFRYTPNQMRDASRHIVDYEFYVDDVLIKKSSFGNIKNNPIEQVVKFKNINGKEVKFVPKSNTDKAKNCGIAEFSVITD